LKAGFEVQAALLAATPPIMDASFAASKSVVEAYASAIQHQQKILLEAFEHAPTEVLGRCSRWKI